MAVGKLATFRQKRDGAEEYIDGEAERIEYDGRTDRVEFFEHARLRREAGDDVRGNYISYDARTEFFTVQSAKNAPPQSPDARVRVIIMPKRRDADAQAAGTAPAAR